MRFCDKWLADIVSTSTTTEDTAEETAQSLLMSKETKIATSFCREFVELFDAVTHDQGRACFKKRREIKWLLCEYCRL